MISYRHKCIFVHIPKTGGTSVEKIIWPIMPLRTRWHLHSGYLNIYGNPYQTGGLQHLLARQIKQDVGDERFDSYFKFTFVRNPWDKTISQYFHMLRSPKRRRQIGLEENAEFKTYLSLIQKHEHVHWEHQHKFFLDENGEMMVDFIGKFENFDADLEQILQQAKLNKAFFGFKEREIPHLNKGSRKPYREYYDTESMEIVQEMYAKDIDVLGYEF